MKTMRGAPSRQLDAFDWLPDHWHEPVVTAFRNRTVADLGAGMLSIAGLKVDRQGGTFVSLYVMTLQQQGTTSRLLLERHSRGGRSSDPGRTCEAPGCYVLRLEPGAEPKYQATAKRQTLGGYALSAARSSTGAALEVIADQRRMLDVVEPSRVVAGHMAFLLGLAQNEHHFSAPTGSLLRQARLLW